jgi:hypothetical protein
MVRVILPGPVSYVYVTLMRQCEEFGGGVGFRWLLSRKTPAVNQVYRLVKTPGFSPRLVSREIKMQDPAHIGGGKGR